LNDLATALDQFLLFSGRWEERVQLSARVYGAMRALNKWSEAGWRAYRVAWIQLNRDNINEAVRWTERCTEAWTQGGSKYEQATGLFMRGLLLRKQKDYAAAEQLLQSALMIWRELKDDHWIAIVLNDLGVLERARKQYDKADQYYREALALAEKQNFKEPQAYIIGNLGTLAFNRERWAEAGAWYEKSLPLSREVGRQDLIASDLYGLARLHEAEGHPDLALPLAQEALTIRERLRHRDVAETRELVERLKKKVGSEQ
jgi:tetratricopeptide (TPR) repeat protein